MQTGKIRLPDMETYPPPRQRQRGGEVQGRANAETGREVRRRAATARAGGFREAQWWSGAALQSPVHHKHRNEGSPRGSPPMRPKTTAIPQRLRRSGGSVRSSSSSSSSPRAEAARLHMRAQTVETTSKKRLEHILDENRLKIGTVRQVIDSESRSVAEGMIPQLHPELFQTFQSHLTPDFSQRVNSSMMRTWQRELGMDMDKFTSSSLAAEFKMNEILRLTAPISNGAPHPLRTAVCLMALAEMASQQSKCREPMRVALRELTRSIYPERDVGDTPNAVAAIDATFENPRWDADAVSPRRNAGVEADSRVERSNGFANTPKVTSWKEKIS